MNTEALGKDVQETGRKFVASLIRWAIGGTAEAIVDNCLAGLYGPKNAANYLDVSVSTLSELRRAGERAPITLGKAPKYTRETLHKDIPRIQRKERP